MKNIFMAVCFMFSQFAVANTSEDHLETIIGYVYDQDGIVFQVFNGGCTSNEDFYVQVDTSRWSESLVSLYRKRFDKCKAFFPYGKLIKVTYEEMGIDKNQSFRVVNPLNPGYRF